MSVVCAACRVGSGVAGRFSEQVNSSFAGVLGQGNRDVVNSGHFCGERMQLFVDDRCGVSYLARCSLTGFVAFLIVLFYARIFICRIYVFYIVYLLDIVSCHALLDHFIRNQVDSFKLMMYLGIAL